MRDYLRIIAVICFTCVLALSSVLTSRSSVSKELPSPTQDAKAVEYGTPSNESSVIGSSPSRSINYSAQGCINYDTSTNTISVSCSSTRLTDIDNKLHDPSVLAKQSPNGVWFLSANLVIAKGSTFHIDSTDTKWLKMSSKVTKGAGVTKIAPAYIIDVHGSLKIDSVKITSWDPLTNDYAITNGSRHLALPGAKGVTTNRYIIHLGAPRPFIKVEKDATGTTDITNSEIAYLGYESGITNSIGSTGLNYYGGDGSVLRGNNIHDLYFGFYSRGVGHISIENNTIHDNGHYGLDPHTGTHDMIIRNNTVYGNKAIGIICSLNCYNILIDSNTVHDNVNSGIMFSRNMTNSIARDNIVYNEGNGIFVTESYNNQIYKNMVSKCVNGINIGSGSSNNKIHDNMLIKSSSHGISVNSKDAAANTIYSNILK